MRDEVRARRAEIGRARLPPSLMGQGFDGAMARQELRPPKFFHSSRLGAGDPQGRVRDQQKSASKMSKVQPREKPLVSPLCGSKREFSSRFGSHGQQLLLTVGFSSRTAHDYRKRRVNRGYPSQGYQGRSPCLVRNCPTYWTNGAIFTDGA